MITAILAKFSNFLKFKKILKKIIILKKKLKDFKNIEKF